MTKNEYLIEIKRNLRIINDCTNDNIPLICIHEELTNLYNIKNDILNDPELNEEEKQKLYRICCIRKKINCKSAIKECKF